MNPLTRSRCCSQGINAAIDSRNGSPVYRLPKQPEFLFSEEAAVHRRSGFLTGEIIADSRNVR
jgi:hypothetical protein